ncbi:MAG: hypothetical protein Ct9H300mP28_18640 [Pseudomonadota bacterium]|nr:MAG: hypothetical protein Ct9H300mP28_18640 [Pseudomonadota bacterium]
MYRMLVITDKDGNPNRYSVGEIIGSLTQADPSGEQKDLNIIWTVPLKVSPKS